MLIDKSHFKEANKIVGKCLKINSSNADAVYVRALCVYPTDLERGLDCLKRAIALDPDHKKTKALAFKLRRFKEKEETGIT